MIYNKSLSIVSSISDINSGGGKHLKLIFDGSINNMISPITFIALRNGSLVDYAQSLGINVIHFPVFENRFLLPKVLFFLYSNKDKLIYNVHDEFASFLFLFLPSKINFVITLHRSLFSGSPWCGLKAKLILFLENHILSKKANKVICVSDYLSNELTKYRNVSHTKVVTIPNKIDIRSYFNLSISPLDKKYPLIITSILRPTSVKGFELLLSSFSELVLKRGVNANLFLLGINSNDLPACYKSKLKNRITCLGIKSNVVDYLNISDIYIQPSFSEAFGYAPVEASFHKIPVLTSNLSIFERVLSYYDLHFTFNLTDDDSLLDTLCSIVYNLPLKSNIDINNIPHVDITSFYNQFSGVFN